VIFLFLSVQATIWTIPRLAAEYLEIGASKTPKKHTFALGDNRGQPNYPGNFPLKPQILFINDHPLNFSFVLGE
jgi:hypothetical protein